MLEGLPYIAILLLLLLLLLLLVLFLTLLFIFLLCASRLSTRQSKVDGTLAFYGGLRWIVESNVTERLSLSSPDPLSTKTTKAGIAPSPRCDVKTDFAEKKKLLLLIYSDANTNIEEKTIKEPSLLLPEKTDQPIQLRLERGRQSRSL